MIVALTVVNDSLTRTSINRQSASILFKDAIEAPEGLSADEFASPFRVFP